MIRTMPLPPAPILVVDDEPDLRQLLAELMKAMGYAAVQAGDGLEALEQLSRGPLPCLVLLDLMMPRMNGEEFIGAIRGSGCEVPVISMSASERTLAPPLVSAHLHKPFGLEQLAAVVERVCPRGFGHAERSAAAGR